MKFRPIRGSLKQSMAEAREFETWDDVFAIVRSFDLAPNPWSCTVAFKDYFDRPDERIEGWEVTMLVMVNLHPVGYSNGVPHP